jgi:hypothetical protein
VVGLGGAWLSALEAGVSDVTLDWWIVSDVVGDGGQAALVRGGLVGCLSAEIAGRVAVIVVAGRPSRGFVRPTLPPHPLVAGHGGLGDVPCRAAGYESLHAVQALARRFATTAA